MPDIKANQRILAVFMLSDDSNNDFQITQLRYFRDRQSYDAYVAAGGGTFSTYLSTAGGFVLAGEMPAAATVVATGNVGDSIAFLGEFPAAPSVVILHVAHQA